MISPTILPNLLVGQTRVTYEWLRLAQLDQWWQWVALIGVAAAISYFVVRLYRADSAELPKPVGWALMILRLAALIGLLLHFFQLEKRSEHRVVRESKVAILVDTSLSMTLPGTPVSGVASSQSRIAEARSLIADSELLSQLSAKHQVSVYRFDSPSRPILLAALERPSSEATASDQATEDQLQRLAVGRVVAKAAMIVGGLAVLAVLISVVGAFVGGRHYPAIHWALLVGVGLLFTSLALGGFAVFPNTGFTLSSLISQTTQRSQEGLELAAPAEEGDASAVELPEDWQDALQPGGTETRLGDAIRAILEREVGNPLAAMVVLTDGRSNAGIAARQAAARAAGARVPLHMVGVGSEKSPPNLQLVEVDLAKRLYPGDRFTLAALLGNTGFAGREVTVQVLAGPKDTADSALTMESEQTVTLPADGELSSVEFQLEPKAVGQWDYQVNLIPPAGDADQDDNSQRVSVEVIQRKNRVLIVAGGPTREYQFVRNLLYRDRDVESHVWLQTGTANSSQEAQELLEEFPDGRVALSEYDAILSFDADWTAVPDSAVQAMEQWVAEQAGGFLLVAGSVEMPKWVSRSATGTRGQFLGALSPVVLERSGSRLLASGRVESPTAWPLKITPEGMQSEFMWIAEDPKLSEQTWEDFDGVYGFYSTYQLKPGAKALAYFGDPATMIDGQLPIYMASQFYGAGRVVFLGGGEIWRLRRQGDQYFDRFYVKLIRWISQGRLLLDSDRGVLLVDREQAALGEQVAVRAVLKTPQYEPLIQAEVVARLIDAQGRNVPLVLRPLSDGSQPGVYTGQFPVLVPGEYSVELQLGGLKSTEMLQAAVRARVPASEMQNAERNDPLMLQMAADTSGQFWAGANATIGNNNEYALVSAIGVQDTVAFLPGAQDASFQVRWLGWLMVWIALCLSVEWLARRSYRLA